MLRRIKRAAFFVVLFASVAGTAGTSHCGETGGGSDVPTGPTVADCEANNTAKIRFRNSSNSNRTYTVIWDGATLATVSPGSETQQFTVAAGVQHTLVFRFTNTSTNACTPSTPTLAQCAARIISCTG